MHFSINFVQKLETLMKDYGHLVFKTLSPGCLAIYTSLFGCWLLWQLIGRGAIKGELKFSDLMTPLLTNLTIISFLTANTFFEWLYDPLNQGIVSLLDKVISVIGFGASGKGSSLAHVLQIQHDTLDHIFKSLEAMMRDSSFVVISLNMLGSLLLSLPFTFLYFIMLCFWVDYMFKLMAVTTLSPILIIFAGFSSTRSIATSGLRMVLHGIFTIFGSVIAMGLSLYVMKELLHILPINAQGEFKQNIEGFAFSRDYWGCFVAVCVAIYLQLKVPTIANISGVSDGPGAAGFVAGVASAAVGIAGGASKHYAQKGAQKAWGAASEWAGPKIKNHLSSRGSSWENPALNNIIDPE